MKFPILSTFVFLLTLILISCFGNKRITTNEIDESETDGIISESVKHKEKMIIVYKNKAVSNKIRTVLLHQEKEPLSIPIINLNSKEKLHFSFDDLDGKIKDYYYTIIHCNANWTKSDLMQSEYIDGFTQEPITKYEFSFNTIQKYTHYEFTFPIENIRPTHSGNYIFKIFIAGRLDSAIIIKRFMILDTKVNIQAEVKKATLVQDRNSKHEIDFTIKHPDLVITDPFSDIKVIVKQNNKEDNMIMDLKPLFVKNNELIYDYQYENTFWGNNEFRHFDIKSLRYQSERIRKIIFDSTYTHVYLFDDKKRPFERYSIEPDINGKFLIKSQEGWKSTIEADYAFVHFTLPIEQFSYGNLYLLGEFTNWQLTKENKLHYNTDKMQYEGSMYLKQGYYNYHYALLDTSTKRVDVSWIEGTHYQTRNDYYIYVYYRAIGERYDRLIGFIKTSSKELF